MPDISLNWNIPPCLLIKECSKQSAPSLCAIFNLTVTNCSHHLWMEKTNVTPLHIKDFMEPTENYRPISLLCIISNWNVVSVLNFTIMLNNSSVLSSMAFCEIASTLHSCYLLMPLVKTWTKIFKQKLSTWTWLRLSIPLITKLCYNSSNDMVRKAACFFGLQIT